VSDVGYWPPAQLGRLVTEHRRERRIYLEQTVIEADLFDTESRLLHQTSEAVTRYRWALGI